MGQRQVREGDTVDDGLREEQAMRQPVAGAADDTGDAEREGSVRRPLIRATLKHPAGTPPPPREPPVFTMHQQTGGDGRDAPPANRKQGRGRGDQVRSSNDRRYSGSAPGNNRSSGNQAQREARPGSKSRSSRRGRGRSR